MQMRTVLRTELIDVGRMTFRTSASRARAHDDVGHGARAVRLSIYACTPTYACMQARTSLSATYSLCLEI
jgi:hypothetical protein